MAKTRHGDDDHEAGDGAPTSTGELPGSVWFKPERPDRGSASPLSRTQIVRAAIALVDEDGLDALSMRKLAARMGVGVMSLYWHVERKDDLLELIADAIFGEMDLPDEPTGDWRADLTLVALETRAIFSRHPWLLQTIGSLPHFGPNFLRHAEFSFGSLSLAGVEPATMAEVVSAVDSFVFGSLLTRFAEARADRSRQCPMDQVVGQFRAALARGQYPALEGMMSHFERWVDDDAAAESTFRFGLDCLLEGIDARLALASQRPAERDSGE